MPKSVLDTDIFSEILKGLHKVGREERIQQFLQSLIQAEILALDARSAELAGRIFADLERTGQPIGAQTPWLPPSPSSTD